MQTSQNEAALQRRYTLDDAEHALTLPKVWWAYAAILPAAKRLSVWIANRTRFTPNQITLVSFAMVMVSAALFYQGSWPALIIGAFIYQFNYLLDCVDGTVARLKNQGSLEGGFLDFFSDHLKNFIALLGLSYGYYIRNGDASVLIAAMVYIFLDQTYLLRDAKVDSMLRKDKILFFTAPSVFTTEFAPARWLVRWMSRAKLYTGPTIVDVWVIVFSIGPIINRVRPGIFAGCFLLAIILLYHTARFIVAARRSKRFIRRLMSDDVITIALFGTGAMARRFYEWADEKGISDKIIYAADNDRRKWGKPGFLTKVVDPEKLRKAEANIVIVASQHGYYDIALQLREMRLKAWRDYVGLACS